MNAKMILPVKNPRSTGACEQVALSAGGPDRERRLEVLMPSQSPSCPGTFKP